MGEGAGAIRSMVYPNPLGALERMLREKGAGAAVALFRQQQLRYPKGGITPRLLNSLGYMQLREKRIDDALRFSVSRRSRCCARE